MDNLYENKIVNKTEGNSDFSMINKIRKQNKKKSRKEELVKKISILCYFHKNISNG